MSNDDLGQFPLPPQTDTSSAPSDISATPTKQIFNAPQEPKTETFDFPAPPPVETNPEPKVAFDFPSSMPTNDNYVPSTTPEPISSPVVEPNPEPIIETASEPVQIPSDAIEVTPPVTFEETPEAVPSFTPDQPPTLEQYYAKPEPTPEPAPEPTPYKAEPAPATLPTKHSSPLGPFVFFLLFLVAVGALAGTAFLYQQTMSLRSQLSEVTNTLEKQQVTENITPTPTETIPTPTNNPILTPSITLTPTVTPTPTVAIFDPLVLKPLSNVSKVLQIAINHSPNAQFILLKSENVNDSNKIITKYFFRQDLTTKKYFYIMVNGTNQPEIVDKAIYVTPDNNIPSMNDLILQNTLGMDLDEALKLAKDTCIISKATCEGVDTKAQLIRTDKAVLWQITFKATGLTNPVVMQIDSQNKKVLYNSLVK